MVNKELISCILLTSPDVCTHTHTVTRIDKIIVYDVVIDFNRDVFGMEFAPKLVLFNIKITMLLGFHNGFCKSQLLFNPS